MGQVKIKKARKIAEEDLEVTKKYLTQVIQRHLDDIAQERGYDNILSLTSYATDPNPWFQSEGQAGLQWRSEVWSQAYKILGEVEKQIREIPSEDRLISELSKPKWPSSNNKLEEL